MTKTLDDLLQERCSIRRYQEKEVEEEKMRACIVAAKSAPSARNNQPWKFIIVTDKALRQKLAQVIDIPIASNPYRTYAPAFVVVVQEIPQKPMPANKHSHEYFVDIDHGLATGYFCLKATELDLGTCIIGAFDEKALKELLFVPDEKKIKIMIAVGYPNISTSLVKMRKSVDDIICKNHYS